MWHGAEGGGRERREEEGKNEGEGRKERAGGRAGGREERSDEGQEGREEVNGRDKVREIGSERA